MHGDSIKALRIVSIAKGWDPQKIAPGGEDISNFNKYPDPLAIGNRLGQLPQGTPINYAEDEEPPKYSPVVPSEDFPGINVGVGGQLGPNRRTTNANPNPGT